MGKRGRPDRHAAARRWIRAVARRIGSRLKPERIVLFGSHAYGRPRQDSDLDLLVILSRPKDRDKRYSLVEDAIGDHLWPMDLLVCTPEEVAARTRIGDPFFPSVLRRGSVLYES